MRKRTLKRIIFLLEGDVDAGLCDLRGSDRETEALLDAHTRLIQEQENWKSSERALTIQNQKQEDLIKEFGRQLEASQKQVMDLTDQLKETMPPISPGTVYRLPADINPCDEKAVFDYLKNEHERRRQETG